MGQYVSNIQFLPIKVDGRYQAVFVTANIEYGQITRLISRWKNFSQNAEILKLIRFYQTKPAI